MDSRLYWIWLSRALPLGDRHMNGLLDAFGTAQAVYEAPAEALRKSGLPEPLCQRLANRSLEEARGIFERTLRDDDWILTPEDALFPPLLRNLANGCPAVLYCRGVLPDLTVHPAVAVVGTRKSSPQGEREAFAVAAGLAAGGMIVVSGGARGIDGAAHRGALSVGGTTIVVMACELNGNYPAESADIRHMAAQHGGLLVSEFPPGYPPNCIYPVRNRLMVGLSQGVLVGQTPHRSGARITARIAREEGVDLFALPAAISDPLGEGGNEEIRNGATLVRGAADILEEYAPQFPGMLDVEMGATVQRRELRRPSSVNDRAARRERKAQKKRLAKEISRRPKEQPSETAPPLTPAPPAESATCPAAASEMARQVWNVLTDAPCPVDELAQRTRLPVPTLLAALTELEMLGAATQQAGQQYRRK